MQKNWVLVGSIGKPYGIKGWVRINSYTEPSSNIFLYRPWYLSTVDQESYKLAIIQHQIHQRQLLVQFENCQSPETVRLLTNHKIYVKRQQLLPLGPQDYYWADLEGLKVYTCENIYLGTVQSLFATGSNDVLIVIGKKRILIPFLLEKTVKSIDLVQQSMIVDWDPNF